MTAKDVHIGLLGGSGCNTGGTGECQPVELGATFTSAAYGELGAIGLATAFSILVAGAALRFSDGRKRLAKLALVVTALAAAGAIALLVIGPQIKATQAVEAPIGWGMIAFGGGVVASLLGCVTTMRVEREPLRLKTYAKPPEPAFDVREILREQHDGLRPSARGPEPMIGPGASGSLPGPAGPLGAPLFDGAPQLRPLYDHQGAVPAAVAPQLPHRAPTPVPRASAHALAGLDTPAPDVARPNPPTAPPPPSPFVPPERAKAPSVAPPFDAGRSKPASVAPPFSAPSLEPPSARIKPQSVPPPPRAQRPSVVDDASIDPLGKTVPAPSKQPQRPRPRVPLPPRTPPAPKTAPLPTPTPSIVTSAPKPASRSSQPTLAHAVPPMPQIDTPPPQLRAPTDADNRLETALRETEAITAVEIDHEAKAKYEETRRQTEGRAETATGLDEPPDAEPTGMSEPPLPRTTSEERAAIHDEGLAPHARGDVAGDDTDALETAARERVELDSLDPVVPPPPTVAPQVEPPARPPSLPPAAPPISTAPASLPPPKTATLPVSGPTPACPQCESPMAWVEEHLRFYCKSCRMYF